MIRSPRLIVAIVALALLQTTRAGAHHSFAAEYDAGRRITLTGTVTRVEWMNPHVRFFMDAKDEHGQVTAWELTMGSATGLTRRGWQRSLLKVGDIVTVNGFGARDGSRLANARLLTLSDGRQMYTGAPPDSPAN
jgi:Family of unknown function (DUF6152)